jgi:hypothetical protein
MLLHQPVQRSPLRAMPLVVDPGAGQWFAREAPEVVSPYGLKLRTVSQLPRRAPTCGYLPSGGHLHACASVSVAG